MSTLLEQHSDIIEKIWESSGHGTEREDVERAFLAGVAVNSGEPIGWYINGTRYPLGKPEKYWYYSENKLDYANAISEGYKIEPRYTANPINKELLDAVKSLKGVADEYDELIRHMDAGGDFHEFQANKANANNESSSLSPNVIKLIGE